jgi:integrase
MRSVRVWIGELMERSPWTAFGAVRAIKSWCRFLVDEGYVIEDPLAKMRYLKEPETSKTPVATLEDIDAVLATCADDMEGFRDRAIISLLRCTGMRRGELVQLTWKEVDFGTNSIELRPQTTKSGRSRIVGFDQATRKALRLYSRRLDQHELDNQKDLTSWTGRLWMSDRGELTANGITQMLKRRSKRAGVTVTAHSFRRSLAMRWLRSGNSEALLMRVVDWKSPRMVARYVASVADEEAVKKQRALLDAEQSDRNAQDRRSRLRAV